MIIKGGKRIKLHKKQGHLKKFQGEADKCCGKNVYLENYE